MSLALALITTFFLAAAVVIAARRRPSYSHVRCTISELGEDGARDGRLVSLGVFLPVGLGTALIAGATMATHAALAGLSLSLAIGYAGAAFFPCDAGAPLAGSRRQQVHNLAGLVEYVGGAVALWLLAGDYGGLYRWLAADVAAATIVLSIPSAAPWRGLVQRIAEVSLFGGLAYALLLQRLA